MESAAAFSGSGGIPMKLASILGVLGLNWGRDSMEMAVLHTLDKVAATLELSGREFHGGGSTAVLGTRLGRARGSTRGGGKASLVPRERPRARKACWGAPARSRRWSHACARRRPRWRPSVARWKKTTLPPVAGLVTPSWARGLGGGLGSSFLILLLCFLLFIF